MQYVEICIFQIGVGIPDVVAAPMVIMGDRMNDDSSTKTVHVGNVDPLVCVHWSQAKPPSRSRTHYELSSFHSM